ncbi:MAG: four helix bundle protein [Cyanobacteria bacterium]|nr:four helix bundle protein [Cyanobacteriota bacterium]
MPNESGLVPVDSRTFKFALSLISAYRASSPRDDADRLMWRQVLKSGTSAGANTAESRGSQSKRDWIAKRFIALREMRETQFWLRLMSDAANTKTDLEPLLDEASQLVAILTTSLKTARRR